MKIHEFQAKLLFKKYDIPVPIGDIAFDPESAKTIANGFEKFPVVVKAQIHAGGRGKGGGVQLAQSFDEVQSHADSIIGMNLVTHQTGPEGRLVKKVLSLLQLIWLVEVSILFLVDPKKMWILKFGKKSTMKLLI